MKVKQFLDTTTIFHWGADDLQENRAGRLSAAQLRMIKVRLYQFAVSSFILFGLILLPLFTLTAIISFGGRQSFTSFTDKIILLVGLIVPPWIVLIYGYTGVCLLQDVRVAAVERDCGLVKLEMRRRPPRFRRKQYILLDQKRRCELSPFASRQIHENENACIYYAPYTRLVVGVESPDVTA